MGEKWVGKGKNEMVYTQSTWCAIREREKQIKSQSVLWYNRHNLEGWMRKSHVHFHG